MRTANIRAVLFDAVDTLIHPRPPVEEAYGRIGRRFGSARSDVEIDLLFRAAWAAEEARDVELDQRTSEDRERERWRNIVGAVFKDVADQHGLFAALWDHFAAAEHWAVFPDVAPVWRRWHQAGLQLGIASNFDRRLHALCQRLPPLDSVDCIIVSSLVGRRKPQAQFFAHAAAALNLPPAQILFVGDSLEHDYQPALDAGLSAILLKRHSSSQPADGIRTAKNLTEVANLFTVEVAPNAH